MAKFRAVKPIRPYGYRIEAGSPVELKDADVNRYVNAGLVVPVTEEEEKQKLSLETEQSDTGLPKWKLQMSPADYLEKFPKGPHAELALNLVALADDVDDTDEDEEGDSPDESES